MKTYNNSIINNKKKLKNLMKIKKNKKMYNNKTLKK